MWGIFSLSLVIFVSACIEDNMLDLGPLDRLSDETVWQDEALINSFVMDIYTRIQSEYDFATSWMKYAITDEGQSNRPFHFSHSINDGVYNASNNVYSGYWTGSYAAIRKCNLVLENINDSPLNEDKINRYRGEVKFLRALFYMDIYFHFGRFPIVDKALTLEDELNIPRATDEESVQFILDDLDSAAELLPEFQPETGRATKGAAYAYKARLLLNTHDYEGAASAAEDVFDLGIYNLFEDFSTLFHPENDNNVEIIFAKQFGSEQSGQTHSINTHNNPRHFTGFNSGIANPSQNLVDEFYMVDGLPWDESPLYDPNNPYENRDPRFYSTFLYDGMEWFDEILDMERGSFFNPSARGTETGYYMQKFMDPEYDFTRTSNPNYGNAVLIRLADVYLIYAEAKYRLGDPGTSRQYVNYVRQRAGMPDIEAAGFSFESIMRERQVELAFEGQRWFDIRRWDMGPEIIGQPIYGVLVTDNNGEREYERIVVDNRVFHAPRMYLFPIPLNVLNKYPPDYRLEQNPGWN